GLGVDEAYTLTLARRLTLSYFDHPPLHQWIAHFTGLALGEGVLVRLPFIALFALTGWLMYLLTRELFGPRAGLLATFALNVTPFFFASAGSWIVPDGPLLFALSAAALCLERLLFSPSAQAAWRLWLGAGFFFGLAGLSKYSAVLIVLGLALYFAFAPSARRWLADPAPYCAAVLALAMTAPVVWWNAENNWISFAFQGARGALATHWSAGRLGAMVLGEIALLSPWVAAPLIGALIAAVRAAVRGEDDGRRLFLLCLAAPSIIVFTLTPLWGARGLPHWPMPGWFFAFPLLGAWLVGKEAAGFPLRAWGYSAVGLLALIAVLGVAQADSAALSRALGRDRGEVDPTLEALSWSPLSEAPAFRAVKAGAFVVATKWSEAGKIAQALGPGQATLVFSNDPRGFAFLDDPAQFVGEDAVIVVDRKRLEATLASLAAFFERLDPPQFLSFGRSGLDEIDLALVPAHRLLRAYPLPYPSRGHDQPPSGAQ
ncbi:MAG TPA: glycosyltransferase family 39 protein, partial [Roseiarcus sp.]|nr:glycosyltransferase family 39 protein [Roseiarcus sp.]